MIPIDARGNVSVVIVQLENVVKAFPQAMDVATKAVGERVKEASLEVMERLYWVADKGLTATGRGYLGFADAGWNRIGALRASEHLAHEGTGEYLLETESHLATHSIMTGNNGPLRFDAGHIGDNPHKKDPLSYAEWRYGGGEETDARAIGSHWRREGLRNVESELPQIFEKTMADALESGLAIND